MKKLLSVLLAVILCFGTHFVVANAENEAIVISAKGGTAAIGDTITVPISLDVNKGFDNLGLSVKYDPKVLEIVCKNHVDGKRCTGKRAPSITKKQSFRVGNSDELVSSNKAVNSEFHDVIPYNIQWAYVINEDILETGEIASITFRVKENATLGKTSINVEIDQANSESFGRYSQSNLRGSSITIDVNCLNHKFGNWNRTKNPTCTEKGIETRACSICKKEETRDVEALGHKMPKWSVTKEPTCTEEGIKQGNCTACGVKNAEEKIPAKGHSFGKAVVTKEATCINEGILSRKCTVCNIIEKTVISKGSHKQQNPIVTLEPTCTEEGIMQGKCTVCGEKNAEEKIPAKGHSFGKAVITKEATATEKGIKTSTCTVCGEKKQEEIPPTAPLFEDPKEPTESESKNESESQTITVITDNKDSGDTVIIFLLVSLIVVGLAAIVISVIKIKKLK